MKKSTNSIAIDFIRKTSCSLCASLRPANVSPAFVELSYIIDLSRSQFSLKAPASGESSLCIRIVSQSSESAVVSPAE